MSKPVRPHLRKQRLGEVLRARGQISAEDLYEAIQEQRPAVARGYRKVGIPEGTCKFQRI